MSDEQPAAGKDAQGRFTKGNKLGGKSKTPKQHEFRACLLKSVGKADFRRIVKALVQQAIEGEGWAIRESLRLLVGTANDLEAHQRLLDLEASLGREQK